MIGRLLSRPLCALRKHRIEYETSMSPGGPPYWLCRCGRVRSTRHPVTGLRPKLTNYGWDWDLLSRLSDGERRLVNSGPDCGCGHLRADHVGSTLLSSGTLFGFFDGYCQIEGCACTGYLPGDERSYSEVGP